VAHLRALLRSDLAFHARRRSLEQRVKELRALKRGPLRYAALLRLYAPCAQAFRAAVLAPPPARPRILNHCLVPLYPIDASPHLRPRDPLPHPPWPVFRRGMRALLEAASGAGPRAAEIVSRLRARDRRFFASQAHRLPLALHGQSDALVRLRGGRPWTVGPAVLRLEDQLITGGKTVSRPQKRHFRVAMSRLFFAHGKRTHLTLFASRTLASRQLVALLERAADVGFYTLGLGGVQRLSTRRGYWQLTERPPVQPRELVISLAPSSEAAQILKDLPVDRLRWDKTCAGQDLGLVIRADGPGAGAVVPAGRDGRLPPVEAKAGAVTGTGAGTGAGTRSGSGIGTGAGLGTGTGTGTRSGIGSGTVTGAAAGLAAAAARAAAALKAAFPGQCGLWVSPGPKVTFAQLVAVVRRLSGAGTFGYLGYRIHPPKPPAKGDAFARRVKQRRAARIKLRRLPRRLRARRDARAALTRAVRPCYLAALDSLPTRWALLSIQSTPEKTLVNQQRGTAPEEVSLNECVADAVQRWRKAQGIQGLLRFQLRLQPGA
jgi:hypothetical protein